MIIAINAGHCPEEGDPGACGKYSTEADIVENVANILCYELEAKGYTPLYIREDEISDICSVANEAPADIFVSIHCNGADSSIAKGTETFYWHYDDSSFELADLIQDELVGTLGTVDRGLKSGENYYGEGKHLGVLNGTFMEATVLVELGFITNPVEEDLLNDNVEEMAQALCRAIVKFADMR